MGRIRRWRSEMGDKRTSTNQIWQNVVVTWLKTYIWSLPPVPDTKFLKIPIISRVTGVPGTFFALLFGLQHWFLTPSSYIPWNFLGNSKVLCSKELTLRIKFGTFSPPAHFPGKGKGLESGLIIDHAHDKASIKLWDSDCFRVVEHMKVPGRWHARRRQEAPCSFPIPYPKHLTHLAVPALI